jgi:hypothetical protein
MKKNSVSEPAMAYVVPAYHNELEKMAQVARAILDTAGIKPIKVVDEDMEDEASTWVTRIFFIDKSAGNAATFNIKLAEELVRRNCVPPTEDTVLFMTAE